MKALLRCNTLIRPFILLEDLEELRKYLCEFQSFRDACVALLNEDLETPDDFFKLKTALEKWIAILFFLGSFFPFEDNEFSYASFSFTWGDSFTPMKKESSSLFLYEKLGALFNFGAAYSNLGFSIHRKDSDTGKQALAYFQKAASVFRYITETLEAYKSNGVLFSLFEKMYWSSKTFEALVCAQAQICVYEKAVLEQLSRSLLSKLAFQVSEYFSLALKNSKNLQIFPLGMDRWLRSQHLAFSAASHYQKAHAELIQVKQRSEGYGGVIVRLELVDTCCREATALVAEATDVAIDISNLHGSCCSLLRELQHDNETVYLEVLPKASALQPLEGVVAVKVQEFHAPCLNDVVNGENSIENFFVHHVRSLDSIHVCTSLNARISPMLRLLETRVESLEDKVVAFCTVDKPLAYMKDGSLEEAYDQLDKIWEKLKMIQLNGGLGEIEKRLKLVSQEAARCEATLSNLDVQLVSLAHQYRSFSSTLSLDILRESTTRYRLKLMEASKANMTLMNIFKNLAESHNFDQSKEEFIASLPEADSGLAIYEDLKKYLLSPYASLHLNLKKIKKFIHDFTQSLENRGVRSERLHQAAFRRLPLNTIREEIIYEFQTQLEEAYTQLDFCKECFADMQSWWQAHSEQTKQCTWFQRASWMQNLDCAVQGVQQLFTNSQEGLNFFSNLSTCLAQLNKKIDDFRTQHKSEYDMQTFGMNEQQTTAYSQERDAPNSTLSLLPLSQKIRKSLLQSPTHESLSNPSSSYPDYPQL